MARVMAQQDALPNQGFNLYSYLVPSGKLHGLTKVSQVCTHCQEGTCAFLAWIFSPLWSGLRVGRVNKQAASIEIVVRCGVAIYLSLPSNICTMIELYRNNDRNLAEEISDLFVANKSGHSLGRQFTFVPSVILTLLEGDRMIIPSPPVFGSPFSV